MGTARLNEKWKNCREDVFLHYALRKCLLSKTEG